MATIYDGVRVFTAAGGAAAMAADQNTFQDQMILGMEERWRVVSMSSGFNANDWTIQYSLGGTPEVYWEESTHTASGCLVFPLDLRSNERITEAHAYIKGNGAMTGGRIDVRRNAVTGASAGTQVIDVTNGDANPWQQAAIYHHSNTGLSVDVDAGYDYFFVFTNAAAGPVADTWVYSAYLKTQFHKGS